MAVLRSNYRTNSQTASNTSFARLPVRKLNCCRHEIRPITTWCGTEDPNMSSSENICLSLPVNVTNQVTTCENREQYILNFLEGLLPTSDLKSVSEELQKTYIFNKHKVGGPRRRPRKGKFLSARKRAILGLNKLARKSDLKYSELLPLNDLWRGYMRQMLGVEAFTDLPGDPTDATWEAVAQKLMKADYHGAAVSIVRSKCPSLVGLNGIVLQDTKGTFRVLGKDDILRTIPKETVVFKLDLDGVILELFGKELCTRPAERSVKKFKATHIAEL